jgi:hypothetical protein
VSSALGPAKRGNREIAGRCFRAGRPGVVSGLDSRRFWRTRKEAAVAVGIIMEFEGFKPENYDAVAQQIKLAAELAGGFDFPCGRLI